jgi:hypothetical protein
MSKMSLPLSRSEPGASQSQAKRVIPYFKCSVYRMSQTQAGSLQKTSDGAIH